ncbi:MAG: hypothetical protein IH589_02430 [Anaerolineales bacterium]|nr:hypothetical protein [Anaerolineales bacterium]
MDNRLKQDALIEDALQNYPLAPMPHDITASVMARIEMEKRPSLFTWTDFAVALVIALTIGASFIAIQSLPPVALAKLRIQGILLYQDIVVNARWLLPAVLFGAAAFFSALTIPYLRRELTD